MRTDADCLFGCVSVVAMIGILVALYCTGARLHEDYGREGAETGG